MQYIKMQIVCWINFENRKNRRSWTDNQKHSEIKWFAITSSNEKTISQIEFFEKINPTEKIFGRRTDEKQRTIKEKYNISNKV